MLACICELAEPWCVTVNDAASSRSPPSLVTGLGEEEGCTVYTQHSTAYTVAAAHISSRAPSVQSVADVEGGGERLEEEEVESSREGFGWHHKSSPLVKGPGTTSPATAIGLQRLALKSPSSPTGRWHHEQEASPTRPPPCLRHHHRPVDHRFRHHRQSVRSTTVAPSNRTNKKQWSRIALE